jgi:hypothetical protein
MFSMGWEVAKRSFVPNAAKVRFEPTFPIFCAAAKVCLQGNIRLLAVLAIDAKEVVGRYLDNSTRQAIASTI